MMTFIVIGDFILNAQLLDDQRLGKQRVEARQIINAIQNGGKRIIDPSTGMNRAVLGGWVNHPIVIAWRPFVTALKYYTNCIIMEWVRRGNNNTIPLFELPSLIMMPWWVKWDRLHQSHRAMLYRKNPFYYYNKFTIDPEYLLHGYIWLNTVSYENRFSSLDLIAAPIPEDLINPIYCKGILKSGKRVGETCNRLIKNTKHLPRADGRQYCTIHRKTIQQ
ncbi:Hypothetical protein HVR_LOCUS80 [uncultured virus]|nr:Hypothetical protein HVR_LOCUS80 [uncultured virus]